MSSWTARAVAAAPSFQTCFACVHMYILYTCVYICVCVYECRHDICIYMHVCMYLYIYTFIHVCTAHTKYLCVQLRLILHFEVCLSVTTDFPVNWPQCQRPCKHPIIERVFSAKLSLFRRLPLEGCLRFQHNLFQFL